MQETRNYKLKKPEYNEYADVMDINHNMDVVDQILKGLDERLKKVLTKEQTDSFYAKIAHRHNVNDIDNLISTIQTTKVNNAIQADNSDKLRNMNFIWSGQAGQPPWLWGGADGKNMYVYNPSNFSVANSNSVQGFQFRNNNGILEVLINGVWMSVGGRQYTVIRSGSLRRDGNKSFSYSGGSGILRSLVFAYDEGGVIIIDGISCAISDLQIPSGDSQIPIITNIEFKNSITINCSNTYIRFVIQTEK
ncbi:hypothetical protein HMPREF1142_2171 [Peptostreptococcaceae bacterium AS15]|nr:hypothetical protein HMPREF1142_2171 [Peptostreptococcaceae bacterium AS15]